MGNAVSPPGPGAQRFFPYANPDPWSWIPGTWIQPGIVFLAADGDFFRFVERTDEGWKAEPVEPSTVGPAAHLAEITDARLSYQRTQAARDELDQRLRDGEDTPEGRALINQHNEELHQLRDRLILLCNGHSLEARAAAGRSDKGKWTVVIVLAVTFLLAAVACIRRLFLLVPEQAGRMVAGAVFFLSGAGLFVVGVRELAKHKARLVTGNLVGCYTLFVLALTVIAFGVMFVSVALLYLGAYGQ